MALVKVGVVVPTLGRRDHYLRAALGSIRSQEGVEVELHVVAPEGLLPPGLIAEFGASLVADPGRGLSAALNAGLKALGPDVEFFGWLGDDDLLRPAALQQAVRALQQDPARVMVYGRCDYIDADGRTFFVSAAGKWASRIMAWGPNLIPQPGSLMRRDVAISVGGLDEELQLSMDLDLFLKLRRVGRLVFVPHTMAAFRWHPESLTVGSERASFDESDLVRQRHAPAWLLPFWPVFRSLSRMSLLAAKTAVRAREKS